MVHIEGLKNFDKATHLAVNIGHSALSVTLLSKIKYENVLDDYSPVLENEKHRLQTIFIRTLNPTLLLSKLKELLQDLKLKELCIFVERNEKRLNQQEENNWTYIKKQIKDPSLAIRGCNFLLKNIRDEAYILKNNHQVSSREVKFINPGHKVYPHILVTFAEDVSFTKVISPEKYESLGVSSINMHSLLRLAKPLFAPNDVNHTVSLAKLFTMTSKRVSDIPEDLLHSSQSEDVEIKEMSTAFGLVKMFCNNIGQMSTFYSQMHNISKVIFGENISDEIIIKQLLTSSVHNFSEGSIDAIFLRHENFINGIGAILSCTSEEVLKKSWQENYCESTGMTFQFCFFDGIQTQQLTMDSLDDYQLMCPLLLCPDMYCPDTQNLNKDVPAREYWIKCIKDGVAHGIERTVSETSDSKTVKSLRLYKDLVLDRMDYLNSNPQAYGELSMRILQDTMEHMKRETGLITMYEKRKQNENFKALEELEDRLKYIDSLGHKERQEELIISILAGNMFDWGAKEVVMLMNKGKFGFMQAMEKLPVRPWLIDDLDLWVKRTYGTPHEHAMIFCDNSGYDLILGIIPFIRDLLQRGTKVILCANKDPVINDVTHYGLRGIIEEISKISKVIKDSYEQRKFTTMEICRSTCCLDLSFIDAEIAEKMTKIDLLVIEGMGRAIHTNLNAMLNCETLRVGVVKDKWFSKQLGGDSFACICKYSY